MRRSEINTAISNAETFFADQGFSLPPFAHWNCEMWSKPGFCTEQFRKRQLGWDVTDFGSGSFHTIGLTLFTLRNGVTDDPNLQRSYAEKIMLVEEGQLTPLHFHHKKVEDIINRGPSGTGELVVRLFNSTEGEELADTSVLVLCDGAERRVHAGEEIVLRAGESITIPPRLYHCFHSANGPCLVGEVSTQNDDADDNRFFESLPRFSEIVEDVAPLRLLCTEYPH